MSEHFVQFYEEDSYHVNQVTGFIRASLLAGDAAIVIATKPHRDELEKRLKADISRAAAKHSRAEQYVALDAADTLSKLMVDGRPDEGRLTDLIGPVLKQAVDSGNGRVPVLGEMVALLCTEGKHEAAIRLEACWNNLSKPHSLSIFCAYPMRVFPREADGGPFLAICDEHSRVRPAESYQPPANAHEHFRNIALFQQKVIALEAEVAKREEFEQALQRR